MARRPSLGKMQYLQAPRAKEAMKTSAAGRWMANKMEESREDQ